ncbi:hypothetical protein B0H19DRAFT_581789 [Mycena capillaripes]|nr:hypothetical protein B0H19DRAFT_581789 [Mycena capillaripes]
MFEAIVKKILARAASILKDLGVDCAENLDSAEPISDTEGIDILCESVLNGVQSQIPDCSNQDLRTHYWYAGLSDIIQLLRHPRTEFLLPRSWVRATSADMKLMIPTTYVFRSVNTPVLPVPVASHATLSTPSIRPRRKRMARLWRVLRSNVTPNNNVGVDVDNAEPGEIIPPSALSPPSGSNSSVNNTDSAKSSQLLHSSRSSFRIGSPVLDDELCIPSAALDISDNESEEESNLHASSCITDRTALPRSLPRSVAILTPENTGHPLQTTSPVATAARLVDRSTSAAMAQSGERLDDVCIGDFERHLDAVPIRPDHAAIIGDFPVSSTHSENELFIKLPPDSYNNAIALASVRVGALSILLNSEPEASAGAGEENHRAQSNIIPESPHDSNSAPQQPEMPPSRVSSHAFSPSTSAFDFPPLLRTELSQSLQRNLRRHTNLSRADTLGPQPRPYLTPRRALQPANPLPRNLVSLNVRVRG